MSQDAELQQQINETKKAEVAYRFMTKKLSDSSKYVPCEANAQLLAGYIDEYCDGEWSVENLDEGYEHLKARLVHSTEPTLEPAVPAPTMPEPKITVQELASDGLPLPPVPVGCGPWPKTRKAILALPADEYRSLYHSRRYGPAFRTYVNEILRRAI